MIVQVGTASAKIVADVRAFARDAKRELDAALARLRVDPVEVDANTRPFERALDRAVGPSRAAGRRAGDAFSDGFWTDVNGRVHDERGRFVASMGSVGRDASQEMTLSIGRGLSGLGPSLALSPGVIAAGAAIGAVLGSAAITAFSGIILGAGLLGLGVFALLGGREERQKALEDLDKAKDAVKRAEEQAKSGSATSIRNLKEARQQLAETQKLVNSGKAFKELDDAVTNLGDTLKRVGQEAARPLLEPLTTGIGDLSELVDSSVTTLRGSSPLSRRSSRCSPRRSANSPVRSCGAWPIRCPELSRRSRDSLGSCPPWAAGSVISSARFSVIPT